MLGKKSANISINGCKSFLAHHNILLKGHYFLSYASLASVGLILSIAIRSRGFSNAEASYMNVVVPFLVFFTNPLMGYIADHTRRYRLMFNVTFGLGCIFLLIMFFLPSLKTSQIQGELHRSKSMEYSLKFCANKDFALKCHLRRKCGCIYHAQCTLLRSRNHSNEIFPWKRFDWNFTMNEDVKKEKAILSRTNNKQQRCDINYRVSINETILPHLEDQTTGNE